MNRSFKAVHQAIHTKMMAKLAPDRRAKQADQDGKQETCQGDANAVVRPAV
jgi:hypothetical protein